MFGILLAFLIGPFVLWGGNFGASSRQKKAEGVAAVAVVGDTPIPAETFREQLQAQRQQQAQFGGKAPTAQQMLQDGTAMKVLDGLVGNQLLAEQAQKGDYQFDRDYLVGKIKEWQTFQDETGKFDPARWNEVVRKTKNWNDFYESERMRLARSLVVKRAAASARVLDADIRKKFEDNNTTFELKYVAVAPKIAPTEEQIKETYDKNTAEYNLPEKRRAEFVAVSLVPPKPALADEVVKRARNGEDFAKLATEISAAPSKETGGDLDWMREGPVMSPHQKPVFALKTGEVSEPIDGPNGYYIYKVEGERTDPTSNEREVKAREILISAKLSPDEYSAAQDKAKQVQEKAKPSGDLRAAAAEAGLDVQTSGQFSVESLNIENVADSDARFFRSRLAAVGVNDVSDSFEAQRNIYVAKITELEPAAPQPLDAVHDKAEKDTIARIGNSPEYRKQCEDLAKSIEKNARSLQDIVTQHPELEAIVESIPSFSAKTYDFNKGPMWNPRDVIEAANGKEAGAFFGPVTDFMGKTYFVELVSKTAPDEKMWTEQWPKEEKQLRDQALLQEQSRRLEDYVAYLREGLLTKGQYQIDQAAFIRALGLAPDQQEKQPEGEKPSPDTETATAAPAEAAATTAPAPSAEPAPAEVPPPPAKPVPAPAAAP
jgi:hypothetical protein